MKATHPRRFAGLLIAVILGILAVAGCGPGHGKAISEITTFHASPTSSAAQADITQAKADVARCITGTPLDQIHTLHVLLLESEKGKNAAEVTATRAKVFGCLGVAPDQQTAFKNDALSAAEKGKVYTKAGAKAYLEVTLPALLAKYQAAAGGTPPPSGTAKATPSAKATP